VVDGVAQQVQQRLLQHLEQGLVDLGLLADRAEANLASERAGELAQRHGELIEQRGQGNHPQVAGRAIQIPDEAFERVGLVAQARFQIR